MQTWTTTAKLPLEAVGRWALAQQCDRVLLVVASHIERGKRYDRTAETTRAILGDGFLEALEASEWPGTKLCGKSNDVFAGHFDDEVLQRMVRTEPRLDRWLYIHDLPEDVCFFRDGADLPAFFSVVHENEAYFVADACPFDGAQAIDVEREFIPAGRFFLTRPRVRRAAPPRRTAS